MCKSEDIILKDFKALFIKHTIKHRGVTGY